VSAAAAAAVEVPCAPLSFSHRPQLYDEEGRLMLKNLTLEELEEWCLSIGEGRPAAVHVCYVTPSSSRRTCSSRWRNL
jgi:hypothetical protein